MSAPSTGVPTEYIMNRKGFQRGAERDIRHPKTGTIRETAGQKCF